MKSRSHTWTYRKTIELVTTLTVLTVLFGGYLFVDYQVIRHQSPPSKDCSLLELEAKIGSPVHLAFVGERAERRLVWMGRLPSYVVRSGAPCYVFDMTGHLVTWCPETQEGWRYDYLAAEASRTESISISEAEAMTK
ncbi:hypothetical protein [Lacunimicrobium album]